MAFGVTQAASTPGCAGLDDAGLDKLIQLAFTLDSGAAPQRHHKAAQLACEAYFRGQDDALASIVSDLMSTPRAAGKVLILHRSWDDATLRFLVDQPVMEMQVPYISRSVCRYGPPSLFVAVFVIWSPGRGLAAFFTSV